MQSTAFSSLPFPHTPMTAPPPLSSVGDANENTTAPSASLLNDPWSMMHLMQQYMFGGPIVLVAAGWIASQLWEMIQRMWGFLCNLYFCSLEIPDHLDAFTWMEYYMEKNVFSKKRSRHICLSSNRDPIMANRDEEQVPLQTLPREGEKTRFTFQGRFVWMEIYTEDKESSGQMRMFRTQAPRKLHLSVLGWNPQVLMELIKQAQEEYLHRKRECTLVRVGEPRDRYWRHLDAKRSRPLSSIFLSSELINAVVSDAETFVSSEKWYCDRGIPYRRGYLLYGPPGCGKSSFIMALAGRLRMTICILNLSSKHLSDEGLLELMHEAPSDSIILLEDVDAAFVTRRRKGSTDNLPAAEERESTGESNEDVNTGRDDGDSGGASQITLSGLLNAIDGVTAQEGRLLFMTTNHIENLDPALIRPGRVDRRIYVPLATKTPISAMFERFYADCATLRGISKDELQKLAVQFAERIPDNTHSMAKVQGYLLHYRDDPMQAMRNINSAVEFDCKEI